MRLPALAIMFLTAELLGTASLAQTVDPPKSAPIPKLHPPHQPANPAPDEHIPVPQPRPGSAEAGGEQKGPPQPVPLPSERDAEAPVGLPIHPNMPVPNSRDVPRLPEPNVPPDPRSSEKPSLPMPAAELACREQLQKFGVRFENRPAVHD